MIYVGMVIFLAITTSCSSDATSEATNEGEGAAEQSKTVYYCPMECEGEKTYEEPGSCPVCGMDLVEKK